MDDEEEKLFLESLARRIWKARKESVTIGAGLLVGVGFLTSSSSTLCNPPGK